MNIILYLLLAQIANGKISPEHPVQRMEIEIVHELFRLRNEHKADSAEQYFADTVRVYMKYIKNVSKRMITRSDRDFWKAHPKNKFEMTAPVQITTRAGITYAIVFGKEYLDGVAFQYERIEISFDQNKKIYSFRGFKLK